MYSWKIFILRRETYYFTDIYSNTWATPCNGRSEDFILMESLMGISLKENWQISILQQLNPLVNKKQRN